MCSELQRGVGFSPWGHGAGDVLFIRVPIDRAIATDGEKKDSNRLSLEYIENNKAFPEVPPSLSRIDIRFRCFSLFCFLRIKWIMFGNPLSTPIISSIIKHIVDSVA